MTGISTSQVSRLCAEIGEKVKAFSAVALRVIVPACRSPARADGVRCWQGYVINAGSPATTTSP